MRLDGYGDEMAFTSALAGCHAASPNGRADASWSGSYAKVEELGERSKGLICHVQSCLYALQKTSFSCLPSKSRCSHHKERRRISTKHFLIAVSYTAALWKESDTATSSFS